MDRYNSMSTVDTSAPESTLNDTFDTPIGSYRSEKSSCVCSAFIRWILLLSHSLFDTQSGNARFCLIFCIFCCEQDKFPQACEIDRIDHMIVYDLYSASHVCARLQRHGGISGLICNQCFFYATLF